MPIRAFFVAPSPKRRGSQQENTLLDIFILKILTILSSKYLQREKIPT
jgi:hypothetical protein